MTSINTASKVTFLILSLLILCNTSFAIERPWSDWYQVEDEALNGIWFSWKCNSGKCDWRWDNRYTTEVKIRYTMRHVDATGNEKITSGERRLGTGSNESKEFSLSTKELKGVEVAIIEPKHTGPKATKYVPKSTAEVDQEKKQREEEYASEQQRRAEETARLAMRRAQEERRREDAEKIRKEEEDERREERRTAEREESRRQQEESDRKFQQMLTEGVQGIADSVVQGSAMIESARQQRYALEQQQREDNARRQREASQRQQDDYRRQKEADERRQRETLERIRADEERQRQAEQQRQALALAETERRQKAEKEEAERRKLEQARQSKTPLGRCKSGYHQDGFTLGGGEITLLACAEPVKSMGEQGVQWSISNNIGKQLRVTFDKYYIFSCNRETVIPANILLKPYETIHGTFFSGDLDLGDPLFPGDVCGSKGSTLKNIGVRNYRSKAEE